MCHGITWFHVLCGHADHSLSTLILCHNSFLTGDSCLPCIDLAWLPLKGLCRICREQERRGRRRRRRQIALTAYAAFDEQCGWEWESPGLLGTDAQAHAMSDGHGTGERYDDWVDVQDVIEPQPEADGLDMPEEPFKNEMKEMIEGWLNHPDFPAREIPDSSNEGCSSGLPDHSTVKNQRSCIPVLARKNTGLLHQPKIQRSHIPVSVNRVQKNRLPKAQNELEVIDESDNIDGMELFDRITF